MSSRNLLIAHRTAFIPWSVRLEYRKPLRFEDSDELTVSTEARVSRGGGQLQWHVRVAGDDPDDAAVLVWLIAIPVRVSGDAALSATPAGLLPDLQERLRADETDAEPHVSPVPGLVQDIERRGVPLAETTTPFVINRAQCEMADQWYWVEAAALAAKSGQALILEDADQITELRDTMRNPQRSTDLLFNRPCFLFDKGTVTSAAWSLPDGIALVHHVRLEAETAAVMIEQW
ncbi:hypothetical protein [Nonomuraea insulae]|uniref:Uncharacterized protein n=1 Tax=Nonomuraea insulae TaxID=1616787 RepID=A0ABW1CNH1_9ACTN